MLFPNLLDLATLTISYEGFTNTFSDISNSMFPSPQRIVILENTENVTFSCSQCLVIQSLFQDVLTNITTLPYVISVFSEEDERSYMLLRETPSGIRYTTAHVYIVLELNSTVIPSTDISVIIIPMIVILLIILAIIIILLVAVPIVIKVFYKKCRNSLPLKGTNPTKVTNHPRGTSGNYSQLPNESKSQTERKEYIMLEDIQNREYMTIDETSIIPVETGNLSDKTTDPYYSNQTPIKQNPKQSSIQYVQMSNTEERMNCGEYVSDKEYLQA